MTGRVKLGSRIRRSPQPSKPLRVFRTGSFLAGVIPLRVLLPLSTGIGRLVPRLKPSLASDLRENLAHVHPQATPEELSVLSRECFGSYGRYWAESFRLPNLPPATIDEGFEVIGYEHLLEARESGIGPIMVLPHLGGWEWAAAWLGLVTDTPVSAVVERLEPDDLFDWFGSLRKSIGINVIPLGDNSFARLVRAVKENHVVCLLGDRDIGGTGVTVDFFGQPTSLPSGPALLARRTGAVLLPTAVYFRGNKRVCQIDPPILVDASIPLKKALLATTQTLANAMESLIGEAPGQWHVLQPIWPEASSKPE